MIQLICVCVCIIKDLLGIDVPRCRDYRQLLQLDAAGQVEVGAHDNIAKPGICVIQGVPLSRRDRLQHEQRAEEGSRGHKQWA